MFTITGQAQKTKPWMYVDKITSGIREKEFDIKYDAIRTKTGVIPEHYIYYPAFFDMIDYFQRKYKTQYSYLRVYFAVYPLRTTDPTVPASLQNKITLIFAPVDCYNRDLGNYFNMKPGEKKFSPVDAEIKKRQKELWTSLFIQTVLPALRETIKNPDSNDSEEGEVSDTKSIRYAADNVNEIYNERFRSAHKHMNKHDTITGMKAFFASYTDDGDTLRKKRYKNRLHIQFEFTNEKGDIIYLEDDSEDQFIHGHPHPYPDYDELLDNKEFHGANNGQLCPANCP
jgi:hypothetical protein